MDGHEVAIGNARILKIIPVPAGPGRAEAEALQAEGQTVVLVAIDGRLAGLIGVADPIKPSTAAAIRSLHNSGVKVMMLTGDSRSTAAGVARELGIHEVEAEVLPDQKRMFYSA